MNSCPIRSDSPGHLTVSVYYLCVAKTNTPAETFETPVDPPRFGPAMTSDGVVSGIRYIMTASEIKSDYSVDYADQVFRADITRVDDLAVTRHTVYMAVDNLSRCSWLAQDEDQPHARDLRRAAMRGYRERLADAPM